MRMQFEANPLHLSHLFERQISYPSVYLLFTFGAQHSCVTDGGSHDDFFDPRIARGA